MAQMQAWMLQSEGRQGSLREGERESSHLSSHTGLMQVLPGHPLEATSMDESSSEPVEVRGAGGHRAHSGAARRLPAHPSERNN